MNIHSHPDIHAPRHRSASIAWRANDSGSLPPAEKARRRMTMEPRISVITLGVSDVAAAALFYTRVGLQRSTESDDSVAFFQLGGGLVLALFGRDDLANDADITDCRSGFGGMSIGYNTRSALETDKLVAAFIGAGGRLLKEPGKTFWGGYCGYVADPDGHVWEIAYNPHWELKADGGLNLPG